MEIGRVYYHEKYLAKVERENPWIHRGELMDPIDHIEPGSLVDVFTREDDFVGRGYINPNSAIAVRLLTRRPDEEIGKDFFRKRIKQANELRQRIYPQLTSSDYLRFDFTSEWAKIADEILPATRGSS